MIETAVIVILILIMIICLILYCMLYTIYKELTSIKLDLMCKHIIINQEKNAEYNRLCFFIIR